MKRRKSWKNPHVVQALSIYTLSAASRTNNVIIQSEQPHKRVSLPFSEHERLRSMSRQPQVCHFRTWLRMHSVKKLSMGCLKMCLHHDCRRTISELLSYLVTMARRGGSTQAPMNRAMFSWRIMLSFDTSFQNSDSSPSDTSLYVWIITSPCHLPLYK